MSDKTGFLVKYVQICCSSHQLLTITETGKNFWKYIWKLIFVNKSFVIQNPWGNLLSIDKHYFMIMQCSAYLKYLFKCITLLWLVWLVWVNALLRMHPNRGFHMNIEVIWRKAVTSPHKSVLTSVTPEEKLFIVAQSCFQYERFSEW